MPNQKHKGIPESSVKKQDAARCQVSLTGLAGQGA